MIGILPLLSDCAADLNTAGTWFGGFGSWAQFFATAAAAIFAYLAWKSQARQLKVARVQLRAAMRETRSMDSAATPEFILSNRLTIEPTQRQYLSSIFWKEVGTFEDEFLNDCNTLPTVWRTLRIPLWNLNPAGAPLLVRAVKISGDGVSITPEVQVMDGLFNSVSVFNEPRSVYLIELGALGEAYNQKQQVEFELRMRLQTGKTAVQRFRYKLTDHAIVKI